MDARKISMKVVSISLKVLFLVVLVMVLYKGTTTAYYYGYAIFNDEPMEEKPGRTVSVTIDKNTSPKETGKILEAQGLVENATVFYIQTFMVEKGGDMKPGRYELNTSMTAYEMINLMAAENEEESAQ